MDLTKLLSSIDSVLITSRSFSHDRELVYSKLTQLTHQIEHKIWNNTDMARKFVALDYYPTLSGVLLKVNCNTKHILPESNDDSRVLRQAHIASSVSNIITTISFTNMPEYPNRAIKLIPALLQIHKNYPNYGTISATPQYYNEDNRFRCVRSKLNELSGRIWRAVTAATKSSMPKTSEYVDILTQPENIVACYKSFVACNASTEYHPDAIRMILLSLTSILRMAGNHNASYVKTALRNPDFNMTILYNYMDTYDHKDPIVTRACCRICGYAVRYGNLVANAHMLRVISKCMRNNCLLVTTAGMNAIAYGIYSMQVEDFKPAVMEYGIIELIVRNIDLVSDRINANNIDVDSIVQYSISILSRMAYSNTLRQELIRHNVKYYTNRIQQSSTNPKYARWFANMKPW